MEDMSIEELCSALRTSGFEEEVVSTFHTQKISGSVLAMLSDSDMKELGVTTMAGVIIIIFK